jgi:hypothetical protein
MLFYPHVACAFDIILFNMSFVVYVGLVGDAIQDLGDGDSLPLLLP